MWKVVKKHLDKIQINKKSFSLSMKWEFSISFANNEFWPYDYKFQREDCYYLESINDRWTFLFPQFMKNRVFNNTEIFLETDDIVVCIWERSSLNKTSEKFLDIVNIKTELKYRIFIQELNFLFNWEDKIVFNWLIWNNHKTIVLDINSLEKLEELEENICAFFKCLYNYDTKEWFKLDFTPITFKLTDKQQEFKNGYFIMKKIDLTWEPKDFIREEFSVLVDWSYYDIWDISIK